MPQLSIETFVTQYFWFISILLAFYFISILLVIPRISEIYKTRQKCINVLTEELEDNNNEILLETTKVQNSLNKGVLRTHNLFKLHGFNTDFAQKIKSETKDPVGTDKLININKVGENWIKKNLK